MRHYSRKLGKLSSVVGMPWWLCGAHDTELWWHCSGQWHLPFSCTARAKTEPPQKERTGDVLSCWTAADQAPNVFLWKETKSNRVFLTALKIFSLDKIKNQHKQWLHVSSGYISRNFCVNTEEGINWLKHDTASLCGFEQVVPLIPQSDPCLPVLLPEGNTALP